jgi:nucleotide-binding universal stress UspA family protein
MLKTVLVAVDNSELAWHVIEALDHMQLDLRCLIVLAHIVPPPPPDETIEADRPQPEAGNVHDARAWLDQLREKIEYPVVPEIVTGDPAEEIVRLSGIHRCDLVVIGSRGLRGLSRILQGSVSSQVVEDAPCSVFVVRH